MTFPIAANAADISNQFIKAQLGHGASIDIPRSWKVMHDNEMFAIETTVGAAIDLSGYTRVVEGTESLLVSTFPDPRLYAGVTVTTTAIAGATRASVSALTDAQVKSMESTIRQGMGTMLKQLGAKTSGWTPMEKVPLGDRTVLHISYIRSSDAGDRRVRLYKIFGTGRIFDLALSTSLAHESTNQLILSRIATSFKSQ
nr:hypothetical protein [Nitrosomonas nitrosa]